MFGSSFILKALFTATLCLAAPTPVDLEERSPAAFSTFNHNPVYQPLQQAPLWRVAYSRAIQLVADKSLLLTWEDYPYGEDANNLDTFKILRSTDGGSTWANLSQVHDTQNGWGMRFRKFSCGHSVTQADRDTRASHVYYSESLWQLCRRDVADCWCINSLVFERWCIHRPLRFYKFRSIMVVRQSHRLWSGSGDCRHGQ